MEENVTIYTIAELIHRGCPLTGASSLHSHPNRRIPPPTSSSNHRPSLAPTHSNLNPNPKALTSLNRPAILIGTLTLNCSHHNCLQFTDDSSEICCDILDFNVCAIGKKISVTAWNFIPMKRGSGFLEIIKWKFPDSSSVLSGCSSTNSFYSFPLISGSSFVNETHKSKSRYRIHGAVDSVSPVSVVPCSNSGSLSDSTNIQGFLVRVMACECKLCSSKENKIMQACNVFTKPVFVYFCGAASCWHPVMSKLVGNVITILGLKRKLVLIAKEESQLMFVTTENSVLHVPRLLKKWLPVSRTVIKGKGECGVYTGVVKGVYMHGMVVELDNEVWLLLSDKLLIVPHSLRLGAVISLRNVHFVNPRFSWAKILILGACFKTNIMVESFSPLEARCYTKAESQGLLGNFIESLSFSARLWALLVVSCIRKKFSGILSEKEILGSKHHFLMSYVMVARSYQKKGVAQMYTSSHLPSSVIRARHGVFTELCKHESCGCGTEPYCGNLKLVVPISCFIYHCETKWIKMLLLSDNDRHLLCENNRISSLSSAGKSYGQSKRRIFPSDSTGIVLLGSLKVSPYSGRLQLVDMTGSIDVIVPDLSLNWSANSIYEVIDYNLMVEGMPGVVHQLRLPIDESFSCRSIFNWAPRGREVNLSIFVHFHMSNGSSRNHHFYPCVDWTNDSEEFESGTFHLIQITHKFPLLQKFQGDPVIVNSSSLFVEAVILPWDLVLDGKDGSKLSNKVLRYQQNEAWEFIIGEYCQGHFSGKRHKTEFASTRALNSGSMDDLGDVHHESNICCHKESSKEWKCKNLNFSHEIPCFATLRSANNHNFVCSGNLFCTKTIVKSNVDFRTLTAKKVLMEFNSENSLKYQMQIGGYYIIKHHTEDSFCSIKDFENVNCVKVLITSKTHMWSLTFSSDEDLCNSRLHDPSRNNSSFSSCEALSVDHIEILLQRVSGSSLGCCSDVHLHLSADAMDILKLNLKELEEDFIKPTVRLEGTSNISPHTWTTMTMSGLPSGPPDASFLFWEGNLVSLHGDVVAVHGFDDNSASADVSCKRLGDILRVRSFQELARSLCVHVLVDHQLVRVFGTLKEHLYLIGFGTGVNATFHRVLEVGGPNCLMMTSVSFVEINLIRVDNEPYTEKCSDSLWDSYTCNIDSINSVASGLISELTQCLNREPIRIRCRVAAVHVLVLERKNRLCDDLQLKTNTRADLVDIPLAGFVLDDGSSSSCCWANAGRAATLLRLHGELPQSALESSGWTLNRVAIANNARSTTMYHLERILKKHDRVTVKNYGPMVDYSYQDLTVSVSSENALSSADEKLLKFIIFNACFGTFWTIVASSLDSSAVRCFEEQFMEMEMTMPSMQHTWAREVCCTNPIIEARNVIQELLNR